MIALPFLLLLVAALAAVLGQRLIAVWIWAAGFAALGYAFYHHAAAPLNIAF